MLKKLFLILGDQLFEKTVALEKDCQILMVESLLECRKLPYHKFKLAYLLTCMREYANKLSIENPKSRIHYFNLEQMVDFFEAIRKVVEIEKIKVIKTYEPNNKYFLKLLKSWCQELKIDLELVQNPMFLVNKAEFTEYLKGLKGKRRLMNDFYIWHRRRRGVLVEQALNSELIPKGGKWSFDEENRLKYPKQIDLPKRTQVFESKYYEQVSELILKYFSDNPGKLPNKSWLPLNHRQANNYLNEFLKQSISNFGDYEDAITNRSDLGFHSGLSALMNYGLLTPQQILYELDSAFDGAVLDPGKHLRNEVKINSLEGFIRQIIGWREWIKGMYDNCYDESFASLNFFGNKRPLPEYFYTYDWSSGNQESKYEPDCMNEVKENTPLISALDRVNRLAYTHHIERLMVLSNWMILNQYNPYECYVWFSSQFVDAAEWVMVPNVMGMGLFADGGVFATKPYISGGNYLKKMSDYKDSTKWEKIWTSKFWEFLEKHSDYFSRQPRLGMLLKSRQKAKVDEE